MPISQVALPLAVNPARDRQAAFGDKPVIRGAAAPTRVVRTLAVIAWAAWTGFGVTVGLGGMVQRGLGAVSFVTAIVACVAFCGMHAWQTRW